MATSTASQHGLKRIIGRAKSSRGQKLLHLITACLMCTLHNVAQYLQALLANIHYAKFNLYASSIYIACLGVVPYYIYISYQFKVNLN